VDSRVLLFPFDQWAGRGPRAMNRWLELRNLRSCKKIHRTGVEASKPRRARSRSASARMPRHLPFPRSRAVAEGWLWIWVAREHRRGHSGPVVGGPSPQPAAGRGSISLPVTGSACRLPDTKSHRSGKPVVGMAGISLTEVLPLTALQDAVESTGDGTRGRPRACRRRLWRTFEVAAFEPQR
jgi:hypothetical protein